ncbi:hypothetical protein M8C21_015234 [Ambrosia artemisiifolia]|uniref:Uncharacterized protein n=1 Tax=Ambrosia artemisiifolia TaxID=4212 RepID=A0AAD5C093_AMBAR|nr:hypothetical protein M8C21_015234 [Ambrosia artemisiifolia]
MQLWAENELREKTKLLKNQYEAELKELRSQHEEECRHLEEELNIQKDREERQKALLQLQWKVMSDQPQEDQEDLPYIKATQSPVTNMLKKADKDKPGNVINIPKHSKKITHREYEVETSHEKLGSATVVGHGEEQGNIGGQDSPDLGPFCGDVQHLAPVPTIIGFPKAANLVNIPQSAVFQPSLNPNASLPSLATSDVDPFVAFPLDTVVTTFKIGDRRLGWKGGTVPVQVAASYVIALLVGAYQLLVVHGQGRPPDDVADPSLEDKTVLKERVMIGMS